MKLQACNTATAKAEGKGKFTSINEQRQRNDNTFEQQSRGTQCRYQYGVCSNCTIQRRKPRATIGQRARVVCLQYALQSGSVAPCTPATYQYFGPPTTSDQYNTKPQSKPRGKCIAVGQTQCPAGVQGQVIAMGTGDTGFCQRVQADE